MLQDNESHQEVEDALETSSYLQDFVNKYREFVFLKLYSLNQAHHLGDSNQLVDLSDA